MADNDSSFIVEIILKALDQASGPIRNVNRAVADLKANAAQNDATNGLADSLERIGDEANDAEGDLRSHGDAQRQHAATTQTHTRAVGDNAKAFDGQGSSADRARQGVEAFTESTDKSTDAVKDHGEAVARVSEEYKTWAATSSMADLSNAENARGLRQISQEAESLTRVLPRASQQWRDMASIAAEAGRAAKQSGVSDETAKLTNSYREFDQAARAGMVTASAAKDSYRDFATSFDRMRDSIDKGSDSWKQLGRFIDDATRKAKNAEATVTGGGFIQGFLGNIAAAASGGGLESLDRAMGNLSAHTDDLGVKLVSLSAKLRGLALGVGLGLFEQLDTAVVGTVASLFSLGAAAVQAGATLGGAFAAGIGEAAPAVTVFAATLARLKIVMDAVSASSALQQQAAVAGNSNRISQISATDAVISAEQNLANSYTQVKTAQEGLTQSQTALTQARLDAQRQIQDLMFAEQQAQLQEKGADITLQEAQQNLQQTIQGGGTGTALESAQLQVQEAQLAKRQAPVTTARARYDANQARSRGVDGSPQVISATQAVVTAAQGVQQAEQAIGNATRALALAKDQAAAGTGAVATATNTLKRYLDELTPTERKLYDALERLRTYFTDPSSPFNKIADDLVAPFTKGLDNVYGLLNDRKFLAPLDGLGQAMGSGLNKIIGQLTGKQGADFFETMARDATKSTPLVVTLISRLITMFEEIAKAAVPALDAILKGLDDVTGNLATKWGKPKGADELQKFFMDGVTYLKDFAHWLGALMGLLEALGGDAAPVGGNLLQGWTTGLNQMSDWVRGHSSEVRGFFTEAAQAFKSLLTIIGALGLGMVHLMSAGGLQGLATLFSNVLVPILVDAGKALGTLTDLLIGLLNAVPGLKTFVTTFGGLAVALVIVGKLYGPVRGLVTLLAGLKDGAKAFSSLGPEASVLDRLKAARTAVAERLDLETKISTQLDEQTAALTEQLALTREIAAINEVEGGVPITGASSAAQDAEEGAETEGESTAVAGAEGAGAAGAAGAAAGEGGLMAGASALLLPLMGGLLAGNVFNSLTNKSSTGQSGTGLASELGNVGATHFDNSGILGTHIGPTINPFGFFGTNKADDNKGTTDELKKLQSGLQGVDNPAELSTSKLRSLYSQAEKLLNQGDITSKQRDGLEKLVKQLDPANVAIDKTNAKLAAIQAQWGSTFGGISSATGNVMSQVKQTLATDIQSISDNLGTGTKQGAQALSATITGAWNTILSNTTAAARGTQGGLKAISEMFEQTLKALGVSDSAKNVQALKSALKSGSQYAAQMTQHDASLTPEGYAVGGIPTLNRPTGNVINQPTYITGEEAPTHKEYVIATNPAYRERNQGLLMSAGRDLGMPGFAEGGVVGEIDSFFASKGVSKIGISGIIGNWMQESSLNAGEGGGGLAQWIGGRYTSLVEFAKGLGLSATNIMAQLNFAWHELTTGYRGALEGIQAATSPAQAAQKFEQLYEGAGIPDMSNRIRYAQEAYAGDDLTGGDGHFGSSATAAAVKQLTAPVLKGASGAAQTIGQTALNTATSVANSILDRMVSRQDGGTGTTSSGGKGGGAGGAGSLTTPSGDGANVITPGDSFNPEHKPIASWIVPVLRWARSKGWTGTVDSGYRSEAEQEFLYTHAGTDGISSIVAKPGTSNHEKSTYPGGAVDVDGSSDSQLEAILRGYTGKEKLVGGYLGPADPYHFSADGRRTGGVIYAKEGFSGYTDQPTTFVTSEENQREHVHITPAYKTGGVSGGLGQLGQNLLGAGVTAQLGALPQLPTQVITPSSLSSIERIISYIDQATKIVNSVASTAAGSTNRLAALVAQMNISGIGGFDQLAAAFTVIQNAMNVANVLGKKAASFAGPSNPAGSLAGMSGAYRVSGPTADGAVQRAAIAVMNPVAALRDQQGYVTERQSPAQQDNQNVTGLERQQSLLEGQRNALTTMLNPVAKRLATVTREDDGGKNAKYNSALKKLQASYQALTGRLQTVMGNLSTAVTDTFNAETQSVQDRMSALNDSFGTQQQQLQNRQGTAQAKGNYNESAGLDKQIAKSATAEISKLQPILKAAQASGDTDLVAQVKQQISELQSTAAQAAISAITDAQQAIDQAAQTQQAGTQAAQSVAQAMGNYNVSAVLDKNLADEAQAQITALEPLLKQATAQGDTGTADQIQQEIDQLQGTVASSIAQSISDQVTAITNTFQTSQAGMQAQQGSAQTMGNFGLSAALDAAMAQSAQQEIGQLQGALANAQAAGDTGAVQSIMQQIDQLQSTVTQMTAQMIQDQISGIQAGAQNTQAQVSEMQSISQTQEAAATTPAQFAAAGALNDQALQLNQGSIQSQLGSYQALLGQANAAGDTSAANSIQQTIDQLTSELVSNTQALQDNSAQVASETASYEQARGQFATGVYSGVASIINTVGQTTGVTDVGALQGVTQASNASLQNTNAGLVTQLGSMGGGSAGLASLLSGVTDPSQIASILGGTDMSSVENGMDAAQVTAFEGVIQSLEGNTEAIATNNQQLASLNGQLEQPQTWSSTMWTTFRTAVFNGMGGLLPTYQAPLAGTSAAPSVPVFSPVPSSNSTPTIGTANFNLTHPTEVLDPDVLGEQLSHSLSTAPTSP